MRTLEKLLLAAVVIATVSWVAGVDDRFDDISHVDHPARPHWCHKATGQPVLCPFKQE